MSYVFDSQEMKQEASRLVAARSNVGNNSSCKRMLDKLGGGSHNAMLRLLLEADNLILSLQQQIAKPVSNALHDELVPRGFK